MERGGDFATPYMNILHYVLCMHVCGMCLCVEGDVCCGGGVCGVVVHVCVVVELF